MVFTLPESLWPLLLGNRRETYRLLFQAAWAALREVLREQVGCEPAALMVLHTWNQHLEHYPHLHAVVPGGGPGLKGPGWVRSQHPEQADREKPYLVDNRLLSARFRDKFLAGLKKLQKKGKLKLVGPWSPLRDSAAFAAWLKPVHDVDWVVYIEPPPTAEANPEHVLKYLARYLTGGPISDRRLISWEGDQVTFWARSSDKGRGNPSEPYSLTGVEFTRRWALHILPKGFVKSRSFGGFSTRNRRAYLARCREQLGVEPPAPAARDVPPASDDGSTSAVRCPRCETPMEHVSHSVRLGWNRLLNGPSRPAWYDPYGHALAWGRLDWYRHPPDG